MGSDRIKNWLKKGRLRERLLAEGAEKLTEAELLAIILCVGQGMFKEGLRGQNASGAWQTSGENLVFETELRQAGD